MTQKKKSVNKYWNSCGDSGDEGDNKEETADEKEKAILWQARP